MRFALIDSQKTDPQPKLHGLCPHCGEEVLSKCGRVKIWHWAHKSRMVCDPWWENETEWHRAWKDNFPTEWQEVSAVDPETGETHIADVKTSHGLVVEFQHSPMPPEEMEARERFYGNMIWIVDGQRGDLDLSYFQLGLGSTPIQTSPLAYAFAWYGKSRIMHNWSDAKARVFIDFGDNLTKGPPVVWRLAFFDKGQKRGAVGPYPKHLLIEAILQGKEIGVTYLPTREENIATPESESRSENL
jgi:competence protein CoiA